MQLINPSVEIWKENDHVSHVARCAKVCYASESNKTVVRSGILVKSLEDKGHFSMFRHETRYFIVRKEDCPAYRQIYEYLREYKHCPYIQFKCHNEVIYICTNGNFYKEEDVLRGLLYTYEVDSMEFELTEYGFNMMRYTFCVVTQISTSRELNRVSPNNIAEQSTRYVNFGKKGGITICLPHWWKDSSWFKKLIYKSYWKSCEIMYNLALRFGMKPQDAREFLPLCTATKCVYTYSIDEWQHILDLRLRGKTGKPHPNAQIIAGHIAILLSDIGYNI